jgi:iron-sulfur cluster insertion protein
MTQAQTASYNPTIVPEEIRLSDMAAQQMATLMQSADDNIEGVRVFVTGGGCGGMSYGMTFTDEITGKDKILEGEGYKLVVDAFALSYLKGCDIDFVEQGLNASFVFNNVFQAVGGSGGCSACGAAGGGCA